MRDVHCDVDILFDPEGALEPIKQQRKSSHAPLIVDGLQVLNAIDDSSKTLLEDTHFLSDPRPAFLI